MNGRPLYSKKASAAAKAYDDHDERYCDEEREDAPQDIRQATTAADLDELSEGERAENLVLDLDELRNLELHHSIVYQYCVYIPLSVRA